MATSSGKVILLGEHAVVYGVPALAASLERGAVAHAHPAERASMRWLPESGATMAGAPPPPVAYADDGTDAGRGVAALHAALGARPHRIDVELRIPAGSGLGASAAIGVAAARALLEAERGAAGDAEHPGSRGATDDAAPEDSAGTADDDRVEAAALAWERVFHGNPSGVDVAAALRRGCIRFVRGERPRPVALAEPLRLGIAIAGPPASTRTMVESVARMAERRPEVHQRTLDGIAALVENARLALGVGDLTAVGKLMDLNHMLLAGWFLSTEGIERACAVARSAGALGAKLTGAGGGGAVVALLPPSGEGVLEAWRAAGFPAFESRVEPGGEDAARASTAGARPEGAAPPARGREGTP